MEALDRQIVALLANDGRMSFADLARHTGLSSSAVHQRVKRLEERGVITGYRAVLDHAATGMPLTALISVVPFDPAAPDDIPDRLAPVPEIVSCWSVAGEESYVLLVRVARPQDLEDLLARIRALGSCSTHTTVVLSTPWEGRAALPSPARRGLSSPPEASAGAVAGGGSWRGPVSGRGEPPARR